MSVDLMGILGKPEDAIEVLEALRALSLDEVDEESMDRKYIGSSEQGVDLIIENERVLALQIYVQEAQGFLAYRGELPYRLTADMTQGDVHQRLGAVIKSDATFSVWLTEQGTVKLTIEFDARSRMTMINASVGL